MAKSALSTKEIRELRSSGMTLAAIAKKAGVTKSAIRTRLSPEVSRAYSKRQIEKDPEEHRKRVLERKKKDQRKSLEHATRIKVPWTKGELNTLREEGGYKTTLELAKKLKRTFYSVKRAAAQYKIPLRN